MGIVGVLLLTGGLGLAAGMAAASGTSFAGHPATALSPGALLGLAQASAAQGHGPGALASPAVGPHASAAPNDTQGLAMTYDAADGYILAVSLNATAGPLNNSVGPNELTWKFFAGNWSLVATTGQVPATLGPGLVYDARDGYTLLYGGYLMATNASNAPMTNQTWSYLGGTWSNLSLNSSGAPYSVDRPNLVYDAYDEYVLLFDEVGWTGNAGGNASLWTTWSYVAGTWTNLTLTAGTPPAAAFGGMAYDQRDQYVVYFGGETLSDQLTNSTWTFHGGAWSNITANVTGTPSGRLGFGFAYDSGLQQLVLYGGLAQLYIFNLSTMYSGETWGYAHGAWGLLASNGTVYNPQTWNVPQMPMAYDTANNETVLFGANLSAPSLTAVTWAFTNAAWSVLAPAFVSVVREADTGHSVTLSVTQSPNAGGLSYSYTGLPTGCATQDTATLACAPAVPGTYHVVVTVLGAGGFSAAARTTLVVNPAPTLGGFDSTTPIGEVGIPIGFQVSANSGTGSLSYSYVGLPTGCQSANMADLACVPSEAGSFQVTANVTDSLGVVAQGQIPLTVVASLSIAAVTPSHSTLDVGQTLAVTTTLAGGAGPFGFQYGGLPTGCAAPDQSALSCQPTAVGTYRVAVAASDALGAASESGATVVVNALPSVTSFVASSGSIPSGGSVQLSAEVSGGTGPFQYSYAGLPTGCAGGNGAALTCSGTPAGRYTVVVTVTDATGASASGTVTFVAQASLPGPHGPSGAGGGASAFLGSAGYWGGLAVGAVLVGVVAILGANRIRLAREGEAIVQGLHGGSGSAPEQLSGEPTSATEEARSP